MTLQELENKVHENNVEQKTIDLVQEAYVDFYASDEYENDHLGAYIYEVSICLEVYNPCLRVDIEILKGLEETLEKMYETNKELSKKIPEKY